ITTGFIRMGVPYRIAFAFSAALRMVPTLVDSMTTIMQAQRARGVDLEIGTVFARIRAHLPLVVPVFISVLRSARHLAMALEAKGFGAQRERTYLLELRMRPIDWAVSGLAVVGMGAAIAVLVFDLARLGGLTR
ncbi:MAG: energy-coupling factor transporter transmembrane protein EcfT, partial [Chloroflexota bacterium]|nr:energy-coupling factor transporter transmembrane protein EcfT [Chloroflexota bacterium]